MIVMFAEPERGAFQLLFDRRQPFQQGLAARDHETGMAPHHLRRPAWQMKLAVADIDPHVGVRHHQIGIAGEPEARDIEQGRQSLVGDLHVDMFKVDGVAEILGGAVERGLHCHFDKFSSNNPSAVLANICMLACRSALAVSSVNTAFCGPATAMQLWPAASP